MFQQITIYYLIISRSTTATPGPRVSTTALCPRSTGPLDNTQLSRCVTRARPLAPAPSLDIIPGASLQLDHDCPSPSIIIFFMETQNCIYKLVIVIAHPTYRVFFINGPKVFAYYS